MIVLVNGQSSDTVAITERGLQYGDGLFETIRISSGQPKRWERHISRLALGCERLAIPMPDPELLYRELISLAEQQPDGVLKLLLSRGSGGRGYRPDPDLAPTRVMSLHSLPTYPAAYARDGVVTRLCDTRLAHQPRLAGIKHLNRLEQVLARAEWQGGDIFEGLMCDYDDNVIEGTMTNVLLLAGNHLITPVLTQCGVLGVMRAEVLDQAAGFGYEIEERRVQISDLNTADELWLCNSILGIMPVRELLGLRQYTVSGRHQQFIV